MFRTTTAGLMNSVYSRICFAPVDLGNLGGGGQQQQQENTESDDLGDEGFDTELDMDDDLLDLPEGDRKKINDDFGGYVSDLLGAEDGEGDDEGESPEEMAAAETALAEELKAGLANLRLPDDIIPEDFDPSDPNQLRAVLTSVQTNAASNAIRLMFKPVQATLTRMSGMMRREMREAVQNGVGSNNAEASLREAIPALDNPAVSPFIRMTFKQAQKKHPGNTRAAIAATRKTLSTLGLNLTDTGRAPARGRDQGTTTATGASALDGFGLKLPPAASRVAKRMQ